MTSAYDLLACNEKRRSAVYLACCLAGNRCGGKRSHLLYQPNDAGSDRPLWDEVKP